MDNWKCDVEKQEELTLIELYKLVIVRRKRPATIRYRKNAVLFRCYLCVSQSVERNLGDGVDP